MIRRRSRSGRSGTRRKSRWEGTLAYLPLSTSGIAVPTVADSSIVSTAWARVPAGTFDSINGDIVTDDCTVYRMINSAQFGFLQTTGAGSIEVTVGMGIIAWDGLDDTPPAATDVPFPVQSGGFDWLWWWNSSVQYQNIAVGFHVDAQNNFGPEPHVYQKSMRKLSTGTGLLLVAEVYALINGMTANFGWTHNGRYAVKLP